jgi:hypothetical protein
MRKFEITGPTWRRCSGRVLYATLGLVVGLFYGLIIMAVIAGESSGEDLPGMILTGFIGALAFRCSLSYQFGSIVGDGRPL